MLQHFRYTFILNNFLLIVFFLGTPFLCASEEDFKTSSDHNPYSLKYDDIIQSRLPLYRVGFADKASSPSMTPANVSKLDKKEVQRNYPRTLQESLKNLEGVTLHDGVGNDLDSTFSLRGFTSSSDVTVLLDGVRVNEVDGNAVSYPLLRMSDVESVQVDRGSSSHIYGDGAFGGVIHITSGQASEKRLETFGNFEIGSHKSLRYLQGFSGTLQDELTGLGGKWTYYFNGARDLGDGFRDNGEFRITSFDFKTAYILPEESGRLHFGIKHIDDAISNPGELTFEQYQQNEHRTNKPLDGRKFKNTIIQMGADKKFWDNKITASAFAYWRLNLLQFLGTVGTFTDSTTGSNPDTDLVTTKARSTDLVTQISYDEEWDMLKNHTSIGLELRDGDEFSIEKDAFGGNVNLNAATESERSSDLYNTGLFWREALTFWDRLTAHIGGRHDFHWLGSDNAIRPAESLSRRWNQSSYSTGLTFLATKDIQLFFNFSEGFRVPTVSDIAPFSGTVSSGLKPVKSDSYEIGTRVKVQEHSLLKASYFLIDLEDNILFDSTSITPTAPFGQNINIGQTRRTGFELRIDNKPIEEVELYGSYTWTKAFNQNTNPSGSLPDGRDLGQVPQHRLTWGLSTHPFKRTFKYLDTLRFGIDGIYTGNQHPTAYESSSQTLLNATGGAGHTIKSFTVWDMILSYQWKHFDFYFKVNNVFDNKYYSRAVSAQSFGTAVYGAGTYAFVTPGAPREYFGGVRWRIPVFD
jgi:iron complex outermembrane receptor protein